MNVYKVIITAFIVTIMIIGFVMALLNLLTQGTEWMDKRELENEFAMQQSLCDKFNAVDKDTYALRIHNARPVCTLVGIEAP